MKEYILVARDTDGDGRVLACLGDHVELEAENNLASCDDWYLDEPPGPGLWVWEGEVESYSDDEPMSFYGTYRVPTDDEWRRIRLGLSPFCRTKLEGLFLTMKYDTGVVQ